MIKNDSIKVTDFLPLTITSSAFRDGEYIPSKYTCEGENIMPSLNVEGIPAEAKSLALIVEDPDAPQKTWIHYLAWNIPLESYIDGRKIMAVEGLNDFQGHTYSGPCPPSGSHRYFFKIYALDTLLDLPGSSRKSDLEKAMAPHILAFGELKGLYKK